MLFPTKKGSLWCILAMNLYFVINFLTLQTGTKLQPDDKKKDKNRSFLRRIKSTFYWIFLFLFRVNTFLLSTNDRSESLSYWAPMIEVSNFLIEHQW